MPSGSRALDAVRSHRSRVGPGTRGSPSGTRCRTSRSTPRPARPVGSGAFARHPAGVPVVGRRVEAGPEIGPVPLDGQVDTPAADAVGPAIGGAVVKRHRSRHRGRGPLSRGVRGRRRDLRGRRDAAPLPIAWTSAVAAARRATTSASGPAGEVAPGRGRAGRAPAPIVRDRSGVRPPRSRGPGSATIRGVGWRASASPTPRTAPPPARSRVRRARDRSTSGRAARGPASRAGAAAARAATADGRRARRGPPSAARAGRLAVGHHFASQDGEPSRGAIQRR